MKEEKSEMDEIIKNAQPSDVGGILRKIIGAIDDAERMKRMKFRKESRRYGKAQDELLIFAIVADLLSS